MKKHLLLLASFFTLVAATQAQSTRFKFKQVESGLSGQVAIVGTDGNGHWVTNPFVFIGDSTVKFITPYQFSQANGYRVTGGSFNTGTGTQTLTSQNGQVVSWGMDGRYLLISQRAAVNGVASLDANGQVPASQLPPQAISDVFVVNSQAAMLALVADRGDFAVRTDVNKTFVLQQAPATTLGNWIELPQITGITSVNGLAGPNVSLTTDNISEGSVNFYATPARVRPYFSATGAINYNSSTGAFSHAASGITAGTYNTVTIDALGHATAGSNTAFLTAAALTNYYTKTELQTSGQAAVNWANITNKPTNLGAQELKQDVTGGTSGVITLSQTPVYPGAVMVFLNGQLLTGADYSVSGTTLTLGFTREASDVITYKFSY